MALFARILPGLALLLAATAAAGDGVDHYDLAPSVMRAYGRSVYPDGVNDPAKANPPGPPPDSAVPPPAPYGTPSSGSMTAAGSPVGAGPASSPIWSPGGPANTGPPPPGGVGVGGFPAAAPTQVSPSAPVVTEIEKMALCSWYTRVDYFHWNERTGGSDFVNENGTLFTLGYTRQIGIERFRAELFGGDVHYQGFDQTDTTLIPLTSNTGYLGLRGEYEMVLAPAVWDGRFALLLGVGSRFWIRDLHDGTDDQGNPVSGYQETWWTIYPYLGLETHRHLSDELDLYSESRIGTTALTYQFATTAYGWADPTTQSVFIAQRPLWPRPGVFANVEIGLRGPRFFIAGRAEVMSWAQSSDVQGSDQPNSVMFTAGGRLGFMF